MWIRRDRLFDDCLGFFRIFARHRGDIGKREQDLFVLGILLEHLFVAFACIVGLAFLHVDQPQAPRGREIAGLELVRLLEVRSRRFQVALGHENAAP